MLAKETVFALLEIALKMAWNVARNPLVLYTKPRDIVSVFFCVVACVCSCVSPTVLWPRVCFVLLGGT